MKEGEHHLLLSWLILTGLIAFGLYLSWQESVLHLLYNGDKSYISLAISFIYFLITLHCAKRIWYISNQVNVTNEVNQLIINEKNLELNIIDDIVNLNDNRSLPPSIATEYIHDLVARANNQMVHSDENISKGSELIEVYTSRLKGPDEIGWFATDSMIKLGLLGTIIGFILMLGSVVNVTEFDVTTMQKILAHMSSGMGTALYTTMAGLVCSLLATAQYQMLDRNIDELINTLKHLAQIHIIPRLHQAKQN